MNSNRDEIKGRLREYVESITTADKRAGRNMYKCPLCGSGSHGGQNSNGAFSITGNGTAWKCFSCNKGGDIFDLVAEYKGIGDFKDQLEYLKGEFNIKSIELPKKTEPVKEAAAQPKADYSEYIKKCAEDYWKTPYFEKRGLKQSTVKRFELGYDAEKKAIVIPYNKKGTYYITRSTVDKVFRKPKAEEAGAEPIYNQNALYNGNPCFICESPIDAISIMQAGGNAAAVGGTGAQKLINAVKAKAPTNTLILCFDNDEAGQKATETTATELEAIGVPFVKAVFSLEKYAGDKKDANDLLKANLGQLEADIAQNIERASLLQAEAQKEQLESYRSISGAGRLKEFLNGISNDANTAYTPTGFERLDKELDGGLYAGLYIIGAVSSLGKTTISLQIADQIAKTGQDVLIFSLEMAANELISKSISRITYELADDRNGQGESHKAKTARGITTKSRYANYSQEEKELIAKAISLYGEYAEHIYIHEGIGDIGAAQIKTAVEEHKAATGNAPVILIDYLQILAPYDVRASDKQNTDKAVLELKRLSRDYKTPVIGISSFNRDSYTAAASMTAFKESGAIEYGSDVLIALQPAGMEEAKTAENKETLDKCKASNARELEAVILKNRNGKTGGKISFTYSAMFNHFAENGAPSDFIGIPKELENQIPFSGVFSEKKAQRK